MKYVWATATHKGMVRENNEDSVFPNAAGDSSDHAVLIVADGMGGHVAGEVASPWRIIKICMGRIVTFGYERFSFTRSIFVVSGVFRLV